MEIKTKLNKSKYKRIKDKDHFKFTFYFSKKLLSILGWNETDILKVKNISKGEVIIAEYDCVLISKE